MEFKKKNLAVVINKYDDTVPLIKTHLVVV